MNPAAKLTRCETRVAERIAWGASQKEVADKLFVSRKTVDKHIQSIYKKTECTKSNELSAWWFCKSFNISYDLSPLSKSFVAIFFVLLTISAEISKVPVIRTRTLKTAQARVRKGDETDYLFNS